MTQPFQQWTVLPHGKLVQVDDNILTVVGEIHMPLMDLPRRMTVVRLADWPGGVQRDRARRR